MLQAEKIFNNTKVNHSVWDKKQSLTQYNATDVTKPISEAATRNRREHYHCSKCWAHGSLNRRTETYLLKSGTAIPNAVDTCNTIICFVLNTLWSTCNVFMHELQEWRTSNYGHNRYSAAPPLATITIFTINQISYGSWSLTFWSQRHRANQRARRTTIFKTSALSQNMHIKRTNELRRAV